MTVHIHGEFWCCQVFGDEANMYQIEDVQVQDLGRVGEITITKDDCLMMKVCLVYLMQKRLPELEA